MNRFMQEKWGWIEGTHGMRTQLMDSLTDADLAFNPGGQNMTLGELCREIGEIEYSYIQSLKTFTQDWSYRNPEVNSTDQLKTWYQTLDDDLKAAISAFSDEDLQKTIDRSGGFVVPVGAPAPIPALVGIKKGGNHCVCPRPYLLRRLI